MNGSKNNTPLNTILWRFAALMGMALLIGLYISHKITVMESVYWAGNHVELLQPDGSWAEVQALDIATRDTIQELRFYIEINDAPWWQGPVGLNVAGPFSAEIFWDGEPVGRKGIVGDSPENEVPGTIDSISLIPTTLLDPGRHQLDIRLSTKSTRVQAKRILHIVALGPYRADDRRALRYYAAPLYRAGDICQSYHR